MSRILLVTVNIPISYALSTRKSSTQRFSSEAFCLWDWDSVLEAFLPSFSLSLWVKSIHITALFASTLPPSCGMNSKRFVWQWSGWIDRGNAVSRQCIVVVVGHCSSVLVTVFCGVMYVRMFFSLATFPNAPFGPPSRSQDGKETPRLVFFRSSTFL